MMNDAMSNGDKMVGGKEVWEVVCDVSVCEDKRQAKVSGCVRDELK